MVSHVGKWDSMAVNWFCRSWVPRASGKSLEDRWSRLTRTRTRTRTHTHTHTHTPTSACTPANYQIFRHHQIFQRMSAANNRLQSDQFRRQPPRRKCNSTMAAVVHQHTRFTRSCWAVSSISLLADRVFGSGFWVRDSPLPHVHEHNGNSADWIVLSAALQTQRMYTLYTCKLSNIPTSPDFPAYERRKQSLAIGPISSPTTKTKM